MGIIPPDLNPRGRFLSQYTRKTKFIISLSILGLVLFLSVSAVAPFKDQLFSRLYPKSKSEAQTTQPAQGQPPKPEFVQGEVLVKFRTKADFQPKAGSQAPVNLDQNPAAFSDLETTSIPSSVTAINQKYKVKTVDKVFKGAGSPQQELNKFKQKFSQEIAQGTRKINEAELLKIDLSRTYKLAFEDKNIPIEQAIQELSHDPGIEYAEPNFIFRTDQLPTPMTPPPSPTSTPIPSPTPTPTPTSSLGLSISPTSVDVTATAGTIVKVFGLTSTGANAFQFYGYPTSSLDVTWYPQSGGIIPGSGIPVSVQVSNTVPSGTYQGTGILMNLTGQQMTIPVTIKVVSPTPTPSPTSIPTPPPAPFPNDPYYLDHYPDQVSNRDPNWNPPHDYQWGLKKINAESAWSPQGIASSSIIVAVIDSGVDRNHEDLKDNMWVNDKEIPNNGIDDDNNGYIDDYYGWNFVYNTNDPMDDQGHGSHVSGIINASGNNGTGIAGTSWKSKIMAVKGLDAASRGSVSKLSAAAYYAQRNGANVINASWGGQGIAETLQQAVDSVTSYGVVFVAAAGNSGADSRFFIPAGYRKVISVGSSDTSDIKSDFSNNIGIDFLAPGGNSLTDANGQNILSLRANGTDMYGGGSKIVNTNYMRARGTSMAAPFVSGAAALLLSKNNLLTVEEIRSILRTSADKVDQGKVWSKDTGYGRINLGTAADLLNSNKYNIARIITPDATTFDVNQLQISFLAYGKSFSNWIFEYGEGMDPTQWTKISEGNTQSTSSNPLTISFDVSTLIQGSEYTFKLRVLSIDPSMRQTEDRIILEKTWLKKWNFKPPSGAGFVTSSPAISDIDGDGKKEIIILDNSQYLYIISPDGKLKRSVTMPGSPCGTYLQSTVAVGDVDQNVAGREIILVSNNAGASCYLGNYYLQMVYADGTINTKAPWPILLGNLNAIREVAPMIVDVNGDGKNEILYFSLDKVFLVNSEGNSINNVWPKSIPSVSMAIAGKFSDPKSNQLQVLVATSDGKMTIYDIYGNPIYSFSLKTNTGIGTPGIVLLDVNGDGLQEIIIKYRNYYNEDPFSTTKEVIEAYAPQGNLLWRKDLGEEGFTAGWPVPIITDLNNDGNKEIAVSNGDGIWFFTKDGGDVPGWPEILWNDILNFSSADRDGDGLQEIYFSHSGYSSVGLGVIEKGAVSEYFPITGVFLFTHPIVDDIDNDGHLELLIYSWLGCSPDDCLIAYDLGSSNTGSQFKLEWPLYLKDNQRTSAVFPPVPTPTPTPTSIGNCQCDLGYVVSNNCNLPNVAACSGKFSCACILPTPTPIPTPPSCPSVVCDVNGDGKEDISDGNLVNGCWNKPATGTCQKVDVQCDGVINIIDIQKFAYACPQIFPTPTPTPTPLPNKINIDTSIQIQDKIQL